MLGKIQNTLRLIGKQIQDLRVPQFDLLQQRAQLTWARVITSFDQLPEAYWEVVKPPLTRGQASPYMVFAPAYETFRSRVSEKLICALDHEIYVWERSGKAVTVSCYPLEGISYVEVSSMLLDYRIKICGVTSQGVSASSIFRCSTATDYVFMPILRKIRLCDAVAQNTPAMYDTTLFEQWSRSNYKFMNFARHSLLGGEKVVCAFLQPEIKAERFRILGKTYYRTISPTHTCILTDREMILIREEALQDRNDKYGGIWDFIPLNKIESLSTSRIDGNLLALSIKLSTNETFECLFQASKTSEVEQLPVRFHELTSR